MSVDGKTAIVTGAATGIGARDGAAARRARRARRSPSACSPTRCARRSPAIEADGGEAVAVDADVSDPAAIEAVAARAQEAFGGADILVNNAAIYPIGPWHEADAAEWDAVFATNVRGYFLLAKAVRPQMLARGGGSIVNVASVTFYWGEALLAVLRRLQGRGRSGSRARSRARPGRRASASTPSRRARSRRRRPRSTPTRTSCGDDVLEAQSIKRRGEVEDVARAIAFFAGDDSRFVTGQTLLVDGGWMRG